jgi:hypothetical protein
MGYLYPSEVYEHTIVISQNRSATHIDPCVFTESCPSALAPEMINT